MKKRFGVLFCLFVFVLASVLLMSSCKKHEHLFGEWTTVKEATCTEAGEQKRVCECGESETEAIPAKGHTESDDWVTETELGIKVKKCIICREVLKREELSATESVGLDFKSNGDGTCTVIGIGTCTDKDIVIPSMHNGEKVTAIGNGAFQRRASLTSIVIPNGVTSIGDETFSNCSSLTSVVIPGSVTSIGEWAFLNCGSLTSVVIPSGVTSISDGAFEGCDGLTSIVIPNSATSIGESAFSWCTGLTRVEIPDSVMSIGEYAFSNCSSLTSVVIPDSVISIGKSVFDSCTSLKNVTISNSVTSIGEWAFYDCTGLTSIQFTGTTAQWKAINFGENWDTRAGEYTVTCTDGTVTPNEPEGSKGLEFSLNSDGTYTVTGIGTYTDKEVIIPATYNGKAVTCIESYAFEACGRITSVVIPNSVTKIYNNAFDSCTGLTSVTIGNGVTNIDDCAFYNCSSLTSVVIPDSVMNIGYYAFWGCSSLTSVTIGNGVTSIGEGAFNNCSSLTSIQFTGTTAQWQSITLGYYWNSNTGNYTVTCTDGTVSKGGIVTPFQPETNGSQGLAFTSNGDGTCTVTGIGTCTDTDIVIPSMHNGEKVTAIGKSAFQGCDNLTSIEIPNSVTSIGDFAFWVCDDLTSVEIPNSVMSIGDYAFQFCTGLTRIEIPASVMSMGDYVFGDCNSLIDISVDEHNQYFCSLDGILFNKTKTKLICYPSGKSEKMYHIPSTVTSIGNGAFGYCRQLTNVEIPDSVTDIGKSAFEGCFNLENIKIPSSVTSISRYAFYCCSGLMNIQFTGTTAQWQSITLGYYWNSNTGNYTVTCTDGTVSKDGVVTPSESGENPSGYTIGVDEKGIHYSNLLDFNFGTNEYWAEQNGDGSWTNIEIDEYSQPRDSDGNICSPILSTEYSSYSARKWSLIEGGEVIRIESIDSSPYPGMVFILDAAHNGEFPVGQESANPARAEYVKIRVRNLSSCDQISFGFAMNHTNLGMLMPLSASTLTVDANGKVYESSGEWQTYVFSMYEVNKNTNYHEGLYDPDDENDTPRSRWPGRLYEFAIYPFGYDETDGTGNYPGAIVDIDYVVIGSKEYVTNYKSALEIKESNVQSLELIKAPVKTNYYVGEVLDLTGLELKVTYRDGTVETINTASANVSTFDKTVNSVTLKFGQKEVSYPVNVIGITGIEILKTPQRPVFEIAALAYGFISDGYQFKVNFADGSYKISDVAPDENNRAALANASFTFRGDFSKIGVTTVTAGYFGKSVTFDVTLIQAVGIEVIPHKTYRYNSQPDFEWHFDVYIIFNDGSKVNRNETAIYFEYELLDFNLKTPGVVKAEVIATCDEYNLRFVEEFDVIVETPIGIEVTRLPRKTEYYLNEAFDPAGMQVSLLYDNGNGKIAKAQIKNEDLIFSVNTALPGQKNVTISTNIPGLDVIFSDAKLKTTIFVRAD